MYKSHFIHQWIDQRVSAKICPGQYENFHMLVNTTVSAFAKHLINNSTCALSFARDFFIVTSKAYSDYHLNVFQFIYIKFEQT